MQSSYAKCWCLFFCEWNSRAKNKHYNIKDWPMRENSVPGEQCVTNQSLVDKDKILSPPLHIKFGLMENFFKAMNYHGKCFEYLKEKFTNRSDDKLEEGIFIGPPNS
jgi:hypothetical protein